MENLELSEVKLKNNSTVFLTMIVGNICKYIANTKSTMSCYICKATSSKYNNIEIMLNLPTQNLEYKKSHWRLFLISQKRFVKFLVVFGLES